MHAFTSSCIISVKEITRLSKLSDLEARDFCGWTPTSIRHKTCFIHSLLEPRQGPVAEATKYPGENANTILHLCALEESMALSVCLLGLIERPHLDKGSETHLKGTQNMLLHQDLDIKVLDCNTLRGCFNLKSQMARGLGLLLCSNVSSY